MSTAPLTIDLSLDHGGTRVNVSVEVPAPEPLDRAAPTFDPTGATDPDAGWDAEIDDAVEREHARRIRELAFRTADAATLVLLGKEGAATLAPPMRPPFEHDTIARETVRQAERDRIATGLAQRADASADGDEIVALKGAAAWVREGAR